WDGSYLYVADVACERVLVWSSLPTQNGQSAGLALGATDVTHCGGNGPTQNEFGNSSAILGLGASPSHLIATDLAVFRALYFNTLIVSNHMNATLVLGQPDFTSSSSGTSATTMKFATAAWTDGTRILVGDWINQRVLYWSSYPSANGGAA